MLNGNKWKNSTKLLKFKKQMLIQNIKKNLKNTTIVYK